MEMNVTEHLWLSAAASQERLERTQRLLGDTYDWLRLVNRTRRRLLPHDGLDIRTEPDMGPSRV
jgi:hypothetical protein